MKRLTLFFVILICAAVAAQEEDAAPVSAAVDSVADATVSDIPDESITSEPSVTPPAPSPTATVQAQPGSEPTRAESKLAQPQPKKVSTFRMSVGGGASVVGNFGGGITWANPPVERLTMPYYGGSGYLFFDAVYAEFFVGYFTGGGKWASGNASDSRSLPELRRSVVNLGVFTKYPYVAGNVAAFPLLGIDYDVPISGNLEFAGGLAGETEVGVEDLAAFWVRFGAGFDFGLGGCAYLRLSALYGLRVYSALEDNYVTAIKNNLGRHDAEANVGHGFVLRAGVGYKF